MTASRFPPEEIAILDHGNAPEFFIDGLAYYREESGLVRMGFFTRETSTDTGQQIPTLSVRLIMPISTERHMRQEIRRISTATPGGH